MKIHVLKRQHQLTQPHELVFDFFSRPENLQKITPPDLQFNILTPPPIPMQVGAVIDYSIKMGGLPMRWTSLISRYEPPHLFVDTQLKGPYAFWHHLHRFSAKEEGTLVEDEVHYAMPFGPLGEIAHSLFVKKQLNGIFDHRREVIEKIFASGDAKIAAS